MDDIIGDVKAQLKESDKKKMCIICEENEAEFCIKGLPKDCYCRECATDHFADITLLEKL